MDTPHPTHVYKVADAQEFAQAQDDGIYAGAPVDLKDGFIHFSTAAQLPETLRRHFSGQRDLTLAAVRTADLGDALRWEPSRGGDLFPHLYGNLEMSAVSWTTPIQVAADGSCQLPDRLG
ncbi:MAG TPA: DUF952 domain-containing protein [Devosiaceae bacterium]|jgi:uncharacterized protein (DUF952 family)|nr:DUF952 domain-containing protein [Devosiaceae bacterium]